MISANPTTDLPHVMALRRIAYRERVSKAMFDCGPNRYAAIIRFGRTGNGHAPHFQIEVDGAVTRHDGRSGKEYHEDADKAFADEHLVPRSNASRRPSSDQRAACDCLAIREH